MNLLKMTVERLIRHDKVTCTQRIDRIFLCTHFPTNID